MRLELPLPGSPAAPTNGAGGTWLPVDVAPAASSDDVSSDDSPSDDAPAAPGDDALAVPGDAAAADDEPSARYFERHDARDPDAARCLLIVSPLLPLPHSLPSLLQEALTGEPDFRPDWKWPLLTPRVGPWELVVQMCVGTSQATGYTTGRLYIALDAGFGAYLIVCIDRDPQKLAARQKELLALLAGARLHRDRIPARETADPDAAEDFPDPAAATPTDIVPPQLPPPEIYLKETLFSYLTD